MVSTVAAIATETAPAVTLAMMYPGTFNYEIAKCLLTNKFEKGF